MNQTAEAARTSARTRRVFAAVLAALLACFAVLAVSGCGQQQSAEDAEQSIRSGIDADMKTLTSLDSNTASQLFSSEFTSQLTGAGIDPATVYGPLFSSLTYTIDGVDVDMDARTAVAHLTITNKDLGSALMNYQSGLTDALASSEGRAELSSVTGDDNAFLVYLTTELQNAVNDPALGTVTSNVDVTYTLHDTTWVASDLGELQKALLGGLDTTSATSGSASSDAPAVSTPDVAATSSEPADGAAPATASAGDGSEPAVDEAAPAGAPADAAAADPTAADVPADEATPAEQAA